MPLQKLLSYLKQIPMAAFSSAGNLIVTT